MAHVSGYFFLLQGTLGSNPLPTLRRGTYSSPCPQRGDPAISASSQAPGTLPSCHRRTPNFRENGLKGVTDNSCSLLHQGLQSMSVGTLRPSEPGRNNRTRTPMEK